MHIIPDDLSGPEIRALLEVHFAGMRANSPKDSCHFLDFEGLDAPGVTFWSIWDGVALAGCGALRELDVHHGEIKSMRTHVDHLCKGVGTQMLEHIIAQARERGYQRLSLEMGSSRRSCQRLNSILALVLLAVCLLLITAMTRLAVL